MLRRHLLNFPAITPNGLAGVSLESLFRDRFFQKVALEEVADGKPFKEIEHTIYARVLDFSQLEKASSMEFQEQWEVRVPKTERNAGTGSIRVRMTKQKDGDPVYTLTTKIKANDKGDKFELVLPSNKDNFDQIRFLAEVGMVKERYHFPIEGTDLVWEVDMFRKPDGSFHEWCKIDLEVPDRDAPIPDFPIQLGDIIMPKGYGRQDEEEADKLVTRIYDACFLTKNQFLTQVEDGVPATAEPTEASETPVDDTTQPAAAEAPSEAPAAAEETNAGGGEEKTEGSDEPSPVIQEETTS